jgi:acetoin utilization protein AcuB
MGGNIISLGTFVGDDPTNRLITVKVSEVAQDALVSAMEALGMEIVDARET